MRKLLPFLFLLISLAPTFSQTNERSDFMRKAENMDRYGSAKIENYYDSIANFYKSQHSNQGEYVFARLSKYKWQLEHRHGQVEELISLVSRLKSEVEPPYSNIVSLAEAEIYYYDFSRDRYSLQNRRYIAPYDRVPFDEWCAANYVEKISSLIKESLENSELLNSYDKKSIAWLLENNYSDDCKFTVLEAIANRAHLIIAKLEAKLNAQNGIQDTIYTVLSKYDNNETVQLLEAIKTSSNCSPDDFLKKTGIKPDSKLYPVVMGNYAIRLYNKGEYERIVKLFEKKRAFKNNMVIDYVLKKVHSPSSRLYSSQSSPTRDIVANKEWLCELIARNSDKVKIEIFKCSKRECGGDYFNKIKVPFMTWEQKIPKKRGFKDDRYLIKMPKLEVGYYNIRTIPDDSGNSFYFGIHVTNMHILSQNHTITCIDNRTGEPIQGALLEVGNRDKKIMKSFRTSADGVAKKELIEGYNDIELSYQGDTNSFYEHNYLNLTTRVEKVTSTDFFQDKPIYKPSDTLHYKIVRSVSDRLGRRVVANEKVIVEFNREDEVIAADTLICNEFGSATGKFVIPNNVYTDYFTLKCDDSHTRVSVIDYKIPQIKIDFDRKYNFIGRDSIEIAGSVTTMNDAAVVGAIVDYEVGNVQSPHPITTDNNGRFSIRLSCKDKRYISVNAATTSTTGHTASDGAGYSIKNKVTIRINNREDFIDNRNCPKIMIVNQNEESINVPIDVTITEESRPNGTYLGEGDVELVIDDKSLLELYPEVYKAAKHKKSSKVIFKGSFDSVEAANSAIDSLQLKNGHYKMSCCSREDRTINAEVGFSIVSMDGQRAINCSDGVYFYCKNMVDTVGNNFDFIIGCADRGVQFYVYKISNRGIELLPRYISDGNQQKFSVPLTKQDGENVTISVYGFKDGFVYKTNGGIRVVKRKDNLSINLLSFRDRIEPNTKEKWSVRVSDVNGTPVKSDLLACMYNSALNVFGSYRFFNTFDEPRNWHRYRIDDIYWNPYWGRVIPDRKIDLDINLFRIVTPYSYLYDELLNDFTPLSQRAFFTGHATKFGSESLNDHVVTGASESINDLVVTGFRGKLLAVRSNFNDSGLFFSTVTNDNGEADIEFIAPESLTRWNVGIVAHTKEMKYGYARFDVLTEKKLMVSINKPRFMRDGDTIVISARIDNFSSEPIHCATEILLEPMEKLPSQGIKIEANGSKTVSWTISSPKDADVLSCTIYAQSGSHKDGEKIAIPILTNKTIITETASLILNKGDKKKVNFNLSDNKDNYRVKYEVVKNPLSLVVEVLPVVAYEKSNITTILFNTLYANTFASYLYKYIPNELKYLIQEGKAVKLNRNDEIKQITIENSPWIGDATTATERRQLMQDFYNQNKLKDNNVEVLRAIFAAQKEDGAFSWFVNSSMLFDYYTSCYIAIGFGRMINMGMFDYKNSSYKDKIDKLIHYMDDYFSRENVLNIGSYYYLYMRSLFPFIPMNSTIDHKLKIMKDNCHNESLYIQALFGSAMCLRGDKDHAHNVIERILSRALTGVNGEMYWKNGWSQFWFNRPIETHCAILELLTTYDAQRYAKEIIAIKKWLLMNKNANSWGYSAATTNACYALLAGIENEIKEKNDGVKITQNSRDTLVTSNYTTVSYVREEVTPKLFPITFENQSNQSLFSFANVYYQHFKERDKVKSSSNQIGLTKQILKITPSGEYREVDTVKLGDRLVIRLVIRAEQDMEYVHVRDHRPMSLEVINPQTRYYYEDGMIYNRVTKNSCTDFFFNFIPQGTKVIDYEVVVTYNGNISGGFAEIQSLYAPEIKATTQGKRIVSK